jgi:hypothetical protein
MQLLYEPISLVFLYGIIIKTTIFENLSGIKLKYTQLKRTLSTATLQSVLAPFLQFVIKSNSNTPIRLGLSNLTEHNHRLLRVILYGSYPFTWTIFHPLISTHKKQWSVAEFDSNSGVSGFPLTLFVAASGSSKWADTTGNPPKLLPSAPNTLNRRTSNVSVFNLN